MVQYQSHLNAPFTALADATRRGILEHLGRRDASITDLAGTFGMTLTGMKKHIGVLERTGLVTTKKTGRVRTCRLSRRRLDDVAGWIAGYHRMWNARFDRLDQLVEELQSNERGKPRHASE
ncbi:MAG: winged helix-turn-helix transcriptional regulator [Gemmatimonadetes bacterium]|nr:winged helix-turn-helix transcriptional regulator [Gemmatimonadota bacterium]